MTKNIDTEQHNTRKVNPLWKNFERPALIDPSNIKEIEVAGSIWKSYSTPQFTFNWCEGSEGYAKDALPQVGNLIVMLSGYFPHSKSEHVTIWASESIEQHRQIQTITGAERVSDSNKIDSVIEPKNIYVKAWKWDRKTLHILAHEETHVKAHNSTLTGMKNNADYVGEHLCWYFQSVVSQEGNYTLHPEIDQSGNLISMLDYLKQHPNYTLADLAEPVPDPDGIGDMQTKYARGEILVSFYNFLETTYGTEDFKNFLWIMMNNENYGVVDALNNIYGKKLSDFDKDWRCFYGLPEKNVNLIRRLTTRIKQLIH